jgi:hypothetical protein
MEKDPLKGNSSIPMSFPASYQAVGGQVTFSPLKAISRYKEQWPFIASCDISYSFMLMEL